ncbi:MAG TPA: cytochrome C oxidase subunit IV family protein [Anaerolineaceae bacterium]|nr:cytochrome C oxidase subunit IV family protein [Anaerolineaceae bacterium]
MQKLSPLKRGLLVFGLLAILTAVEFYLGISEVPSILLWIVAIIKMLLVLQYFMHINKVINPNRGGHE